MEELRVVHDIVQSADFLEIVPESERTQRKMLLSIAMAAACNGDFQAQAVIWNLLNNVYGNKPEASGG